MERLFDATLLARQSCEAEFQPCSLSSMPSSDEWGVAGLFAGVGGIELGLKRAGMHTELLCEYWDPAVAVLGRRFEGVPLVRDVRQLQELPPVRLVAAGFPCTDLSQAGFTRGIRGEASGLVAEVFRLLERRRVPWVLLENVRNMLVLDGGAAMNFLVSKLEALGYQWAYRLVDSRFTGVPQRRQRSSSLPRERVTRGESCLPTMLASPNWASSTRMCSAFTGPRVYADSDGRRMPSQRSKVVPPSAFLPLLQSGTASERLAVVSSRRTSPRLSGCRGLTRTGQRQRNRSPTARERGGNSSATR